jgi:hypothetical protein
MKAKQQQRMFTLLALNWLHSWSFFHHILKA